MLAEVKKCVDNNDIIGLYYIFVDSLDVDPTFEKYETDFEYCKKINGFIVPNINLTPIKSRESWNNTYWEQLKLDLMKNFSEERFLHMREVAKVIYADKIYMLKQERVKIASIDTGICETFKSTKTSNVSDIQECINIGLRKNSVEGPTGRGEVNDIYELENQQKQEILKKKKEIELHNQNIDRELQNHKVRTKTDVSNNKKKISGNQNIQNKNNKLIGNQTKKSMGVAIKVLVIAVIIVVVVLINVL